MRTPLKCPKCGAFSGDDWSQCQGSCPLPISPHYSTQERDQQKKVQLGSTKGVSTDWEEGHKGEEGHKPRIEL